VLFYFIKLARQHSLRERKITHKGSWISGVGRESSCQFGLSWRLLIGWLGAFL
jgi:hypothetical protein